LKENKGLIKLLGFEPEKYENLRNEVNTISNEIKMGISSMENTKQIVKEKETRLNEIKQKEKEITEMKGIIEKVKISSNDFTLFKNSLLATQTKLREQFIEESNELMDELWANIYPYEDYIGAKLAVDSGDYTLQLKEKSGKWVDVDAVASGGERSAAALVLRLAFAFRLAENLSWIILDEPTHNLDETAVLKLAALMHNNLPNMLNQTFVITHDNNMRMAATEYIYDIKRNKNMEGWATPEKIEI
ncbi:MAG: hypothetical protein JXA43_01800, partial [Candidatus Diapherotrites archaeon]|nr:hypothetical protein [Candidatus Diapherotrites archaeon]